MWFSYRYNFLWLLLTYLAFYVISIFWLYYIYLNLPSRWTNCYRCIIRPNLTCVDWLKFNLLLYGLDLRHGIGILFFCFCPLFSLLFECIYVFRLILLAWWDRIYFLRCVWLTSFLLFFAVKTSEIRYHIFFSLFWARGRLTRCFSFLNLWGNSRRVYLVAIWGSLWFIFLWTLIRVRLFFW